MFGKVRLNLSRSFYIYFASEVRFDKVMASFGVKVSVQVNNLNLDKLGQVSLGCLWSQSPLFK